MPAPALLILGQATHDHVVPATPGAWRPQMGGNALYAAAGALTVLPPERIAVVTRRGRDYPFDIAATLAAVGLDHVAVRDVPCEHLVEWLVYEADGMRRSLPRNPDLRHAVGEGSAASAAYLERLEALSPEVADVPGPWRRPDVAYVAPQVAQRHRATVRTLTAMGVEVVVDPSPHYTRCVDAGGIGDVLAGVRAVLASEADIAELLARHGDAAAAAEALLAAGVPEVVIKLDRRGCCVVDGLGARDLPALPTQVVDPTGAGDAFGGAFAAACACGASLIDAARAGLLAGAMAVGVIGAAEALQAARHVGGA
jgi:hypothetical protein